MKPNVTFKQVDPAGPSITVQLGDGFATPTATGGWQVVSRPRRVGISDYQGTDPVTQDIPILFDGMTSEHRQGISQEAQINALFKMMRTKVGPRSEPAVIEIHGVPIPFHGARWVINGITPGDEVRRASDGHRVQAAMTVSLLEYVGGDVVVRGGSKAKKPKGHSPAKTASHKNKSPKNKIWVVKSGDTLWSISAKEYGSTSDWSKIAKANNIRDPKSLKIGSRLKIPAN